MTVFSVVIKDSKKGKWELIFYYEPSKGVDVSRCAKIEKKDKNKSGLKKKLWKKLGFKKTAKK